MIDYKAAGIISMKKALEAGNKEAEIKFLSSLTSEESNIYKTALPVSWVPIEIAAQLFKKGATMLYPHDPKGLEKLGRAEALDELTGIYKIFLKMTTVPYLMNQAAKLWRNYHKKGQARVEGNPEEKTGYFIVEDFPELPEIIQIVTSGYLIGSLELTGAKNVQVTREASDSQLWRWKIKWE